MTKIVPLMPDGQPNILVELDVTIARLKAVLEAAFLDCEVHERDYLFISEGLSCPCYLTIDSSRKFVQIYTFQELSDDIGDPDRLVNDLNRTEGFVQFFHDEQNLFGSYWMTYDSGLSMRQFVKMLRQFSEDFLDSVRDG